MQDVKSDYTQKDELIEKYEDILKDANKNKNQELNEALDNFYEGQMSQRNEAL